MKVGRVLPHLGTEATKDSIVIKMTLSAENEALIRYGLQKDFSGPQTPYPATADGSLPTFY